MLEERRRLRRRCAWIAAAACGGVVAAGPSAALAADRVNELVTPAGDSGYFVNPQGVTGDGGHAFWTTDGNVGSVEPDGGVNGNTGLDGLVAGRSAGTWTSSWVTPYPVTGSLTAGVFFKQGSADGERMLFVTQDQGTADDTDTRTDVYVGSTAGVELVSPGTANNVAFLNDQAQLGASDDLDTVAFATNEKLVPADADTRYDVYVWRRGQGLTLASARADGTDPGTAVAYMSATSASIFRQAPALANHSLSADGRTVFFITADQLVAGDGDAFIDVYARTFSPDGTQAVQRVTAAGANTEMWQATPDAAYVVVKTTAALDPADTDGGTADLFRVRVSDGAAELITADAATAADTGDVRHLALSDDGSTVAFLTTTALTAADTDGVRSIYLWSAAGGLEYVAPHAVTVSPAFLDLGSPNNGNGFTGLRLTADGSVLAFQSPEPITADDTDANVDVFVYRRGGALSRISGSGADGNAAVDATFGWLADDTWTKRTNQADEYHGRGMTADGSSVYFTTAEALVAEDVNGVSDVYEHTGGALKLVTTGTSPHAAYYVDNGVDGTDVLFASEGALDERNSGSPLIYDARIGGVPYTPPVSPVGAPVNTGSAGAGAVPAPPGVPSTSVEPEPAQPGELVLPVDPEVDPSVDVDVDRLSVNRRGRMVVPVQVSGPGRVKTVVKAKVRGRGGKVKRRTVARGARGVGEAGEARVKLRLTRHGRRLLDDGSRARGTLRTTFTPTSGDRVRTRDRVALVAKGRGA